MCHTDTTNMVMVIDPVGRADPLDVELPTPVDFERGICARESIVPTKLKDLEFSSVVVQKFLASFDTAEVPCP